MRFAPLLAFAALVAAPLTAHPKLVATSPAPNATVASPARLQLSFSERLIGKFSGASLAMTQMPGMKMNAPMTVPAAVTLGSDGKSLVVSPRKRLGAGVYRLEYHVVSTDTHRIQSAYLFRVK